MNKWILAASLLSALIVPAHVFGGGPEFHQVLLESDLSDRVKAGFSTIWHFTTLSMLINSAVLLMAAISRLDMRTAVWAVMAQYAAFAGLFAFYGMSRLGNLTDLPQWTAFLGVVVLAAFGLRATTHKGIE